jgi:hypothetical protein
MLRSYGDDLAGLGDKALLLTGFAGRLRRSELVALDVTAVRCQSHLTVDKPPF